MKKKEKLNYLDFIPIKNEKIHQREEKELCILEIPYTGWLDKIAQKLYHTPKKTQLKLDEYGSCVWKHIDGTNTIYDIAVVMKEQFGVQADPVYDRLVKFFFLLERNGLIKREEL